MADSVPSIYFRPQRVRVLNWMVMCVLLLAVLLLLSLCKAFVAYVCTIICSIYRMQHNTSSTLTAAAACCGLSLPGVRCVLCTAVICSIYTGMLLNTGSSSTRSAASAVAAKHHHLVPGTRIRTAAVVYQNNENRPHNS